MRSVALVGILLSTTILGGCAGTIGGITLSSISSFAGLASTLFTGADLGEHAASLLTGKDCRFTEGLMREDRDVCEVPGSLATRDDFHGIFVERIDPDGTVIYAAPKYMPASFGAGEYENKPDAIWAAIKTQKFAEANERQLARANAAQTIDVAALATGSVSSESLAFLPAGMKVDAALADGEPASQTTQQRARTVTNPLPQAAARRTVATPAVSAPEAVELPLDTSQPAIDEKSFAASVQPKENGEGGPLIATTATSSAPVVSTLIHGEPVVVLRLRPIFSANAGTATTPFSSATPTETADASPTFINTAQARGSAPSPLAILDQTSTPVTAEPPATVAAVEPAQLTAARPRVKPAEPIASPKPEAEAKPERVAQQRARRAPEQSDVYQPPARLAPAPSTLSAQASALRAPVQVPVDVPAEPAQTPSSAVTPMGDAAAPAASEPDAPVPAASGGPAPLVPMPQE